MKFCLIIPILAVLLFSCSDNKGAEKKLMDEIMATHERVMASEDKLMDNKMVLDSMVKLKNYPPADSAATKIQMRSQSKALATADEAMDNWMHDFDPHKKNRPENEQLKYLQEQNKQVKHIDTMISSAVQSSTLFLKNIKK